jgi:ubiquitin carboxyl-terminal hydrolase 5/13
MSLFLHADIDDPIPTTTGAASGASAGPEPSAEQVGMLADMGFTTAQAKKALRETVNAYILLYSFCDD